ncbi:MAG TPA: hypothetical protein VFC53_00635 [Dehalococcoidia bacterium]|jgi:hypothetical protein|nr:hypothetical protein [Dehalococcoidia bacterium]
MTTKGYAVAAEERVYEPGEEVLVHLQRGAAFDLERAAPAAYGCLPDWTIAVVLARRGQASGARYLLRFRVHHGIGFAWATAADIEGTV